MKKRILKVILIIIITIIFLYTYKYLNKIYHIGIPCIFHKITNLYCPGCGITRAIFSLMQLDIKEAIKYNPLFIILLPFLITYLIIYINYYIKNINKDPSKIFPKKVWEILLIITIIFGIIRNINYFK
ncbi:MAG: DUF2752 domain-containing protein [Bacilli bacterium]|nr:DUF2752 domain-containing protein [Bacilli bacterium]